MSLKETKVQSSSYKDGNNTPLIVAGSNITVTPGGVGDYTVAASATTVAIATTVTTSGGEGTATINLNPFSFANTPIVKLTTVNASTTQANWADVVNVSTSSLMIRSFVTQSTVVSVTGLTLNPVIRSAGIVVHVILIRV